VPPKEYEDEIMGILAAITNNPKHIKRSSRVDAKTVQRLYGAVLPYFTGQYAPERTNNWRAALPLKIQGIIKMVELLCELKTGEMTGIEFGKKMRLKEIRKGVDALAVGDTDRLTWTAKLEKLDQLHKRHTNSSGPARQEIDAEFFEVARDFLDGLGVTFGTSPGANGKSCLDPAKVQVPDWNYVSMTLNLEILSESIAHRPSLNPNRAQVAREWADLNIALSLCRKCVHCSVQEECALGRPIQLFEGDPEPVSNECSEFKKLPARILRNKGLEVHQET
jgi:hypothetical protein